MRPQPYETEAVTHKAEAGTHKAKTHEAEDRTHEAEGWNQQLVGLSGWLTKKSHKKPVRSHKFCCWCCYCCRAHVCMYPVRVLTLHIPQYMPLWPQMQALISNYQEHRFIRNENTAVHNRFSYSFDIRGPSTESAMKVLSTLEPHYNTVFGVHSVISVITE